MYTEDLVVNKGRETEVVEDLCTVPPHIHGSIFPQAFIIESIYLCDLSAFMIPTNQCDAVWISHLNIS